MRAIDLYAGIGGWSLGLRLAGVQVVASYEWWQPAIDTHNGNHGCHLKPVDIRQLKLEDLPEEIDLVVGSPPCTQFSYSNRGGSGNISEGMKDLVKFFEVVAHLKPRFWAMENVPRVAEVLKDGFARPDHPLYRFRALGAQIEVVDFSEFGTPQGRRRCIATNIPLDVIHGLRGKIPECTLGNVVAALAAEDAVIDPVWGKVLPASALTETQAEPPLNPEEYRMNREAKVYHPIYNNMAFPDPLDVPARTVTATCTRVSRESIVIEDPRAAGQFRRLTIRERASLQGFPITYQFFARSFAEKAKMIGNAIPPTYTHLLALAAQNALSPTFANYHEAGHTLALPALKAPVTPPDQEGRTYPLNRSFRSALPHLRFKSGMRFDLSNECTASGTDWRIRFFFGPSKDIRELDLDGTITDHLRMSPLIANVLHRASMILRAAERDLMRTSPELLQRAWAHKVEGLGPFALTDRLGELGSALHEMIDEALEPEDRPAVEEFIVSAAKGAYEERPPVSASKLRRYANWVLAGIILGDWFNSLAWHNDRREAA